MLKKYDKFVELYDQTIRKGVFPHGVSTVIFYQNSNKVTEF
jgi:hypothetical protein